MQPVYATCIHNLTCIRTLHTLNYNNVIRLLCALRILKLFIDLNVLKVCQERLVVQLLHQLFREQQ